MIKFNRNYLIVTLVIIMSLIQIDLNAQCAMCKQAAETSLKSNPNSIARGLNSGIIYLMVVPYLLIGFIFRKQLLQLFKILFKKVQKSK